MRRQTVRYAPSIVVSRFDSRMHAAYEQLCEFSKQSCARWLDRLAAGQEVVRNGAFAACGGSYVASVYPDGDVERLEVVADCYSAWVFIDDLIDNTTDLAAVAALTAGLRAQMGGVAAPNASGSGLGHMLRLFTDAGWHAEALRLARAEVDSFLDGTTALRAMEAARIARSADDYLALHATNSATGVMYLVLAYAAPGLAEPLLRLRAAAPDVVRRVFRHSGIAVGIVLDLYKVNGAHAQICDYTNLAHVVRRAASPPLALPEAVARCIDFFHHHEDLLATALRDFATFSPPLARAMEHLHAGSVLWLAKMRGGRYVGLVD